MNPVPTKKWIRFLKINGVVFKRMGKGDHEIWDKIDGSLSRPITFISAEKEIPPMHIRTNLKTLGIDYKDFLKIIKDV